MVHGPSGRPDAPAQGLMLLQTQQSRWSALDGLSELHPFLVQLGSVDGLVSLSAVSASLRLPHADNPEALETLLQRYRAQLLLDLELPAICRACYHAARYEVRELVALDQALARCRRWKPLAEASRRVGRCQLERLRPLRDQRVVQRYLRAVEQQQACGWHTLVFGLTLALYSMPVRQGLLAYARQALAGLIRSAARPLGLTRAEYYQLLERLCADLPGELDKVVRGNGLASLPH